MSVLEYSAVATGVLGGLTAAYLGGKAVREKVLVPKLTVMSDLPLLKEERRGQKLPGQAVVCGGRLALFNPLLTFTESLLAFQVSSLLPFARNISRKCWWWNQTASTLVLIPTGPCR